MNRRGMVVRLDNAGDVLLAGPAIRAVAAHCDQVTVLAGPNGHAAAGLLPGVDDVITWRAPWVDLDPPPLDRTDVALLVDTIAACSFTDALVLTSFHQSPLPTALLLRLAGIPRIAGISVDYPGSLLDTRLRIEYDLPEAERALSLAEAAGFALPPGDDGALAVRQPLPDVTHLTGGERYVVLHPGASAPARRWPPQRWEETMTELTRRGRRVVLTGGPGERDLIPSSGAVVDLVGRTDLAELAAVLAGANAVVVANTGPAHLAAAVRTPVVSLFAPVVPAARWAPYRVPSVLLGDQSAPCRDSRAVTCPIPGHPCLSDITAVDVAEAVEKLAPQVSEDRS
jgi:ADP-heptose:LPS heptosyltransferase